MPIFGGAPRKSFVDLARIPAADGGWIPTERLADF